MSFLDKLVSAGIDPTGLATGLTQGLIGVVGNIKAKKQYNQAEEAHKLAMGGRPSFQISPEVKQRLAMEQAQYNAEDQSIKQARAAQEQALANYMGSAQRNASSGTQALATAGEVAGNTMQGAARLGAQQFQNQLQKGQTLAQAQGAMAQQRGLKFEDALAANQEKQAYELGKMQAYKQDINDSNKNIMAAIPQVMPGVIGGLSALLGKGKTGSGLPGLSKTYFGKGTTGFQEALGQSGKTGFQELLNTYAPKKSAPIIMTSLPGQTVPFLPVNAGDRVPLKRAFGQNPFSNTNPFQTPIYPNYGSIGPNLYQ
jgi:hypothetical protein